MTWSAQHRTRRRLPWGLLGVLFVTVPLLEIYVVIRTGQVIGVGWTILILVLDSLLGAYLLKREGTQAWRALTSALGSYRMPARELADGALILVGGTLLLTPGLVTDAVGFLLILPVSRPLARRLLTQYLSRRLLGVAAAHTQTRQSPGHGHVVRGDVVD
jgi:UPF0716 protein FxsA